MSRNYTMIDDLEDISDEMPQQQRRDDIIPNDISEKIKGKIRNNYMAPPSSGMNYYKQQQQHRQMQQMPPPPPPRQYYPPPPQKQHYQDYDSDEEDYPMIKEGYALRNESPAADISCKQIAEHIADCPVCGRLYHHDRMNTIYIIIIVFLSIACLLLLKKNLNL